MAPRFLELISNSLPLQVAIAIDRDRSLGAIGWVGDRISSNFLNHCLINVGTIAMDRDEEILCYLLDRAVEMSEVSRLQPIHRPIGSGTSSSLQISTSIECA